MVVTLTGANDFARKSELDSIVTAFLRDHDPMALERLQGDEISADRLQEALHSLPFLTERKLVVLHQPSAQKAFAETIADTLQGIPDTTDVVIVEPKLDKRLSYYKTLKKATDFREFNELDASGLTAWARAYAKDRGGSIDTPGAAFLIDRIGANQQMLAQELDKLLAFDVTITKQTITALTEPLPQSTVFELLDAAFQGRTARAIELYREQRALKVEPQAIIAMLAWQLHVLAVIKTAANRSPNEIASAAKINPFVVRKSQDIARTLPLAHLREKIDALLMLDVKTKTTSIDLDEALQLYLLTLSRSV